MRGLVPAVVGAVLVAALMTFGDFVWARFVTAHRVLYGLAHGAALCLAIGGYLGALRSHAARGALAGTAIGAGAAAPGDPDYLRHLGSWFVAFLPGFLALLVRGKP